MVVASSAAAAVAIYVLHRRRRAASAIAPKRSWAHGVEVRPSRVAGAGDGLYASRDFAAGEELGEYYGRVLSLLEALNLTDRDYLMGGFGSVRPHCPPHASHPSHSWRASRMHVCTTYAESTHTLTPSLLSTALPAT